MDVREENRVHRADSLRGAGHAAQVRHPRPQQRISQEADSVRFGENGAVPDPRDTQRLGHAELAPALRIGSSADRTSPG